MTCRYRWHGTGPRSYLGQARPGDVVDMTADDAARIRAVHGRDDVLERLDDTPAAVEAAGPNVAPAATAVVDVEAVRARLDALTWREEKSLAAFLIGSEASMPVDEARDIIARALHDCPAVLAGSLDIWGD